MADRIEDYALIGDTRAAALVGRSGSIDWLCAPRFDSPALFAALLGGEENGFWRIAPVDGVRNVERRYRPGTLVLETDFETDDGVVRLVDCMPIRDGRLEIIRIVEGVRGTVDLEMRFAPRFDYGRLIPSFGLLDGGLYAVAGPDAVTLRSRLPLEESGQVARARFSVGEAERVAFSFAWHPSHLPHPEQSDPFALVTDLEAWWRDWSGRCRYDGEYPEEVLRSLITLKALTYSPTGAIVAAATTSLPEEIGGGRNWDYRFCWLRDGAFSMAPLVHMGYLEEALAWRDWLLRAIAGDPSQLQLMYGIGGESRLDELDLPWLSGYEGSAPVRIGNAAAAQFQLDVYGEVMSVLHRAWRAGLPARDPSQAPGIAVEAVVDLVDKHWRDPDEGIWEIRGNRQHFTYSKVSAWTAVDRAIRWMDGAGGEAPDHWRRLRDEIHADVCANGYDAERNTFVQFYGGKSLDASLLMIPISGFLPGDDPRVIGTIEAIQREISSGPFVWRYSTDEGVDGLAGSEGAFLICSFWLVSALAHAGRFEEAENNLKQLVDLRNDVGLFSEEYDPGQKRFLGNFPQAFSHVGLLHAAFTLQRARQMA